MENRAFPNLSSSRFSNNSILFWKFTLSLQLVKLFYILSIIHSHLLFILDNKKVGIIITWKEVYHEKRDIRFFYNL